MKYQELHAREMERNVERIGKGKTVILIRVALIVDLRAPIKKRKKMLLLIQKKLPILPRKRIP